MAAVTAPLAVVSADDDLARWARDNGAMPARQTARQPILLASTNSTMSSSSSGNPVTSAQNLKWRTAKPRTSGSSSSMARTTTTQATRPESLIDSINASKSNSGTTSRHTREVLDADVQEALTQFQHELPDEPTSGLSLTSESSEAVDASTPMLMPALPVQRVARLPNNYQPLTMPRFEDAYQRSTQLLEVDCAAERAKLKTINRVTTKITAEPGDFPPECGPTNDPFQPRNWNNLCYTWKASNLCHKPLYFEQVQAERYGHVAPFPFQPAISAVHFFGSVVLLPYKMGIELPNECIYSLGYYRPGSCAPYQIPGFPLSLRGALFEGAAVAVGIATVPTHFIP